MVGSQAELSSATILAKEQLAALLQHLLAGADRQLQLEEQVRQLESEAQVGYHNTRCAVKHLWAPQAKAARP